MRWVAEWQAFCVAVQFLTVLPIPKRTDLSQLEPKALAEIQGRSLIWYPFVGLIVGGLLVMLVALLPTPFYLTAAIVIVVWAILTGGLHLDGLADCADAWVGGLGDRDKTLALLKDPLCGAMGVLALVLLLLVKTAALAALLQQDWWLWLWLVPLLSRLSLLWLFLSTPYVRPLGLGETLAQYFSKPLAWGVTGAIGFGLLLILPSLLWLLWLMVSLLVYAGVRMAAMKRLSGFTGDIAGAQIELVETAVLIISACLVVGG